ncbi:transporter, cation channel family protein [Oesophagostomum dentatum]|uniref:Transporter, cation channel family protein n=1 Tax=Oesophagostomum dentatum TaxID=61180 RepID=A0A0B1S6D4_OESDE|nr:transporter, cation channel family protein [Oesophagostomum dentatum]
MLFSKLILVQTSLAFLAWMPHHVEINSFAQLLMIFRAMRPLRIYTLVPHIRRVVVEFFRGFKEILLVTILMIVVMFIFASFGVQIVGGKLAACNDPTISTRENCTGIFWQKIFVTRLEVYGKDDEEMHPKILVPRVWTNPRNFNFDHVGNAMLALFETLSYKGWNVIRDILYNRQGPWAVVFIHIYVFIGCMIGLTLFVGVVIANYTENRIFAFLVLLNSACLVVPWNVEEEGERTTILFSVTILSAIINILFAVEIVLKILAFTFAGFWQSRRNRIDMLITVFGLMWIFLHFFVALPSSSSKPAPQAKLKTFTYTFGYIIVILRFFTIASRNSTLKMLMLTVVMGMFRSFFIITAMFLLVLFYAYTGVILFGMVKYGQAVSKWVVFFGFFLFEINRRDVLNKICVHVEPKNGKWKLMYF